jgi:hypothetical protein
MKLSSNSPLGKRSQITEPRAISASSKMSGLDNDPRYYRITPGMLICDFSFSGITVI